MLSDETRLAFPATVIPRDEWISAYEDRRHFVAADVTPWVLPEIPQLSVRGPTVEQLFQKFSEPAYSTFPPDEKTPSAQYGSPDLLTEANVRILYDAVPRGTLNAVVTPVSFDLVDWFETMVRQYAQFEDDYRQALWESTHAFPISSRLRKTSVFQRVGRRSETGSVTSGCPLEILLVVHVARNHRQQRRSGYLPRPLLSPFSACGAKRERGILA
ncbi:unnamed protein product [Phytophthora fragariaefolia]|uniref:Unnamed protein product n=1 Tax=Phytophthora fragariaefolia TaxID=1490495 RepID=A0A9W7CZH0_9STRA|nr:unnamed protein product [Phytophthora fragariaefolia]